MFFMLSGWILDYNQYQPAPEPFPSRICFPAIPYPNPTAPPIIPPTTPRTLDDSLMPGCSFIYCPIVMGKPFDVGKSGFAFALS